MCLSFSQNARWLACHSQVKAFLSRFADEVEKNRKLAFLHTEGSREAEREGGKGGGGCHGVVAVLLVSFEGNQRLVTRLGAAHMETVSLSDRESQGTGNLPFHRLPNTGVFCKACDEPPLAVNVSFVAFTLLAISSDSLVLICCCALCSYSSSTNQ